MKQRMAYLLFIALFLSACGLFTLHDPEPLNTEEHDVVMAVIDSIFGRWDSVYVYKYTGVYTNTGSIRTLMNRDTIFRDLTLLANYNKANDISSYFDQAYLSEKVVLKNWDSTSIYSGYKNFTCPGISANGKWAVVEMSSISGPISGGGMAYMLKKEDDEWRIVWSSMIWIS